MQGGPSRTRGRPPLVQTARRAERRVVSAAAWPYRRAEAHKLLQTTRHQNFAPAANAGAPPAAHAFHRPPGCRRRGRGGEARLHRDTVLVQRQDLARRERGQLGQQKRGGRPVAGERLVRDERVGHVLRAQLHGRLAGRQRVGLREEVAHELVVVGHHLALRPARSQPPVDGGVRPTQTLPSVTHRCAPTPLVNRHLAQLTSGCTPGGHVRRLRRAGLLSAVGRAARAAPSAGGPGARMRAAGGAP